MGHSVTVYSPTWSTDKMPPKVTLAAIPGVLDGEKYTQRSADLSTDARGLHMVVAMRKRQAPPAKPPSKPWTIAEDRLLVTLRATGSQWKSVGKIIGRTSDACCTRMKVVRKNREYWREMGKGA